jgi:hypothetical protein
VALRRPEDGPSGAATAGATVPGPSSGRLRGAAAARLHLTLAAGLAVCAVAFVIEIGRALGGNTLSWAYVFEWPIFAVFALYMWWNLLHGQDGGGRAGHRRGGRWGQDGGSEDDRPEGGTAPHGPAAADPGLAAWQDYLRTMEAAEAEDPDGPGVRPPGPPGTRRGPKA